MYYFLVEKVPLKDLKQNLSHFAKLAADGKVIEVTKHNRSYVQLVRYQNPSIHFGSLYKKRSLGPCLSKARKKNSSLKTLLEDREECF